MTAIPHLPAKTKLEAALARYTSHVSANGANPTADQKRHIEAERNHLINLGKVMKRLEEYQGWVETAAYEVLVQESHDSERLGENMRAAGRPKPTDRHDAHAIVSGTHAAAALSRIALAELQIGIDEPVNGAWLPRSGNDARASNNWASIGAAPHSRIHRKSYYEWVEEKVEIAGSTSELRQTLTQLGKRLEQGAIPPEIKAEMKYDDLQNS